MSNLNSVVGQLEQERNRLTSQIEALSRAISAIGGQNATRGTMSAAGRARIAAAQRARWAKAKRKVVSINSGRRPKMSAAAIARIRAAQKARWAKWRKQQKKAV